VTPLSLGIETLGGITTSLIERNTTVPIKKSQIFSTASDNQSTVDIHVLQGDNKMAKYNISLGRFQLTGIPPAGRGIPQIEVTFDIDANGIIHVSAKDKATGKEQKTEIIAPQKMSKDELDRKMKEAEAYAAQDKEEFEKAEVKNTAEALVYSTEHTLKEYKEKIPQEIQDKVEKAKADLQEAIKKENLAEMKDNIEKLNETLKEIGANMYKDSAGNPDQEAGPGPGSEGEGPNPNENSGPSG